jgi:UDP-glucose 4-epimerase
MRVLVTGASGHLGYYVVTDLLAAGHEAVLFDRQPPRQELAHLLFVAGDISSFEDCRRAFDGSCGRIDAVQHLAGLPYPSDHPQLRHHAARQGRAFDTTMRWNLLGTYYLMQAAVAAGVRVVVMTSSNCALGHNFRISETPFHYRYLPVDEEHPEEPEDTYSFAKLAAEQMLASYTRAYGVRTYAVRASAIHSPEQRAEMPTNRTPATRWESGLWGWVAAEDVASGQRLLMEQAEKLPAHDVYLCTADDTAALEPSLQLVERFQPDLLPVTHALPGHASFHDCAKLKRAVGWRHRSSWRV